VRQKEKPESPLSPIRNEDENASSPSANKAVDPMGSTATRIVIVHK
jgi:hypothetical protein